MNTLQHNFSKQEYYDLLSRARVVVSFALQENFGFSVAEAVYLGCVPVLPNTVDLLCSVVFRVASSLNSTVSIS